jgi:hypothetical protein
VNQSALNEVLFIVDEDIWAKSPPQQATLSPKTKKPKQNSIAQFLRTPPSLPRSPNRPLPKISRATATRSVRPTPPAPAFSTSAIHGTAWAARPSRPLHKPTRFLPPLPPHFATRSGNHSEQTSVQPLLEDEFRQRKGQAEGDQGGLAVVQGQATVPRRPHHTRFLKAGKYVRAARWCRRARLPLRRPRVPRVNPSHVLYFNFFTNKINHNKIYDFYKIISQIYLKN